MEELAGLDTHNPITPDILLALRDLFISAVPIKQLVQQMHDAVAMSFVDSLITYLGDVLSPWQCACCDASLRNRTLLCGMCAETVVTCHHTKQPISFGYYGGALASCLRKLKYGNRPDIARPLGQLLAPVVAQHLKNHLPTVLVPVPVPRQRLAERGYNQVALIAQPIGKSLKIKIKPCVLARRDGSVKQAALCRSARLQNLVDAFWVRDRGSIIGHDVLLLDDISTTGATLQTCSELLLKAGAKSVVTAVVGLVL